MNSMHYNKTYRSSTYFLVLFLSVKSNEQIYGTFTWIVSRIRKYYFPDERRVLLFNAVIVRKLRTRFSTTLCKCERASDRLCIRERCLLSVNWALCRIPLLCLFSTLREVDLDFHISCRVAVPGLIYFTRAIHSAYNADQRYLARIIGPSTCKYQSHFSQTDRTVTMIDDRATLTHS